MGKWKRRAHAYEGIINDLNAMLRDSREHAELLEDKLHKAYALTIKEGKILVSAKERAMVEPPRADSVVIRDGVTVAAWEDGGTTATTCRKGDEFDPLVGVLNVAVRKVTNNRSHAVDDYEETVREIAGMVETTEDLEALIDWHGEVRNILVLAYELAEKAGLMGDEDA